MAWVLVDMRGVLANGHPCNKRITYENETTNEKRDFYCSLQTFVEIPVRVDSLEEEILKRFAGDVQVTAPYGVKP